MRTSIRADLTAALKARDPVAVAALRSALAAIDNAGAVPADLPPDRAAGSEHIAGAAAGVGAAEAERRHLTESEQRSIVRDEVRERTTAAANYDRLGRDDLAGRLRAEAELLSRYL